MGTNESLDLLPGTLELLILKTLALGPQHGYGIAQRLKQQSDEVLQVGESSLYPALQRLLLKGWAKAEWGASENNRRAPARRRARRVRSAHRRGPQDPRRHLGADGIRDLGFGI